MEHMIFTEESIHQKAVIDFLPPMISSQKNQESDNFPNSANSTTSKTHPMSPGQPSAQIDADYHPDDLESVSQNQLKFEDEDHETAEKGAPQKRNKFKRSTNNSHKKFISVIRKLLFKTISSHEKREFEATYNKYKSSRTYFFIILAYIKFKLNPTQIGNIRGSFEQMMDKKIQGYQKEVETTKIDNFRKFRQDEIIDIAYSIRACDAYFRDQLEQAVECIYKKDKAIVVKKQHYETSIQTIREIEDNLEKKYKSADKLYNPLSALDGLYVSLGKDKKVEPSTGTSMCREDMGSTEIMEPASTTSFENFNEFMKLYSGMLPVGGAMRDHFALFPNENERVNQYEMGSKKCEIGSKYSAFTRIPQQKEEEEEEEFIYPQQQILVPQPIRYRIYLQEDSIEEE